MNDKQDPRKIDALYQECVDRVVERLEDMSVPGGLVGDDAPFDSMWELWKHEMQEEHSIFHDLIESVVQNNVELVVEELSTEDRALMMRCIFHLCVPADPGPTPPINGSSPSRPAVAGCA